MAGTSLALCLGLDGVGATLIPACLDKIKNKLNKNLGTKTKKVAPFF